jgi:hypothetical protein
MVRLVQNPPLTRKHFERYLSNPRMQAEVHEAIEFAIRHGKVASFSEAFQIMKEDCYNGPADWEDNSAVTEATFAEAITDPEAAAKIMKIIELRRLKNPGYRDADLRAELAAKTGNSIPVPTDAELTAAFVEAGRIAR